VLFTFPRLAALIARRVFAFGLGGSNGSASSSITRSKNMRTALDAVKPEASRILEALSFISCSIRTLRVVLVAIFLLCAHCIYIAITWQVGGELSSKLRQINYREISAVEKVRTVGRANYPFVEPRVKPETNWRLRIRKIISVGRAAIIAPAARRLKSVTYSP
jgi:hypothetical protein